MIPIKNVYGDEFGLVRIEFEFKSMKKLIFYLLILFLSLKVSSQTIVDYINVANEKYDLEKYQEAIEYFTQAIKLDPKLEIAYTGRGASRSHIKDYKQALIDFNTAINLNPDNWELYYRRGEVRG